MDTWMSLDEFIAKLESIRAEHGGNMPVMMVDEEIAVPVHASASYVDDPRVYITDRP